MRKPLLYIIKLRVFYISIYENYLLCKITLNNNNILITVNGDQYIIK